MDENPIQSTPSRIEDKAPKPQGVIPKNTQSLVIIGVAVLMILIMWLTGGGKRAATNPNTTLMPPPPLTPTDTSQVQAFKQAIQSEQQAARQSGSQFPSPDRDTEDAPSTFNPYPAAPTHGGGPGPGEDQPRMFEDSPYRSQELESQLQPDPIKADEKKREYLSLFASNVALTYRSGADAEKLGASPLAEFGNLALSSPRGGTPTNPPDALAQALRDAQALATLVPPPGWASPTSQQPQTPTNPHSAVQSERQTANPEPKSVNPDLARPGEFNSATGKKYVLFEGTVIETVLINRLNGSFSGPLNCFVTSDVYSHDRQHVLIPAGTKALGEAQKVNALGQERLAVFFHRLIMPDGYSVSLDQFKGLDQVGATALRDKVNNHYARIFGASLAVGLLGGVAQVGTGNIFTESAADRMRAGFGESTATAGERILDRFLNIMPTVIIREGTRVNVYLSNDMLFPDYNKHTMSPDL